MYQSTLCITNEMNKHGLSKREKKRLHLLQWQIMYYYKLVMIVYKNTILVSKNV
jgi:hypothetical protein